MKPNYLHPFGDIPMRVIYFIILLLFVAATGVFVMQNSELISLQYLGQSFECPPWLLIAIVYVVGMVSGWTVIGLVQHWIRRASGHSAH
jgi:uncharacterized integral membrane protein